MRIDEASTDYLARLFVPCDDPNVRGGMWIRHRNGQPPFEPQGFAVGASLHAEVYEGQWIVRCDGCANSQFTSRADKRFFCVNCLNGSHGGQWVKVIWPRNVDQVEAVLLARPNFAHRNYSPPGETLAEPEDPAEALWLAVRKLPDKQRDAVILVYGEGLSHAVVAEAMAISEATVSWHIHEAKKRLKTLMRSAGEV